MTFGDNLFPWRNDDIRRGLILIRTSNNSQNYINSESLTGRIEELPPVAQMELVSVLRSLALSIEDGLRDDPGERPVAEHDLYKTGDADAPDAIKDRNGEVALGLCRKCNRAEVELQEPCNVKKLDWHYVSAEKQNANSHKLEGWFPSLEIAKRHVQSWPASIGNGMQVYSEELADVSSARHDYKAPEHLQTSVLELLRTFFADAGMDARAYMHKGSLAEDIKDILVSKGLTVPRPETETWIVQTLFQGAGMPNPVWQRHSAYAFPSYDEANTHLEWLEGIDQTDSKHYRVKRL